MEYKILRNKAKCKLCNDIIESKHRHDFVRCKCGNLAVDGGLDYLRRSGSFKTCEELTEWEGIEDAEQVKETAQPDGSSGE